MTLTGHKIGGPLGVGALLLGRGVELTPLLHGGGQERDVRSGTLDTPAIAGFAAAAGVASRATRRAGRRTSRRLRDALVSAVLAAVPDARLNGDPSPAGRGCRATRTSRSPAARATPCCCCSTPAASSARPGRPARPGVAQPSHVLLAMGADADSARGSLRFSLGHTSTAGRRRRAGGGDRSGGRARARCPARRGQAG